METSGRCFLLSYFVSVTFLYCVTKCVRFSISFVLLLIWTAIGNCKLSLCQLITFENAKIHLPKMSNCQLTVCIIIYVRKTSFEISLWGGIKSNWGRTTATLFAFVVFENDVRCVKVIALPMRTADGRQTFLFVRLTFKKKKTVEKKI